MTSPASSTGFQRGGFIYFQVRLSFSWWFDSFYASDYVIDTEVSFLPRILADEAWDRDEEAASGWLLLLTNAWPSHVTCCIMEWPHMKSLFYQELLLREQGLLPRPQSKLQRRQGQEGQKGEGRIKGRTKERTRKSGVQQRILKWVRVLTEALVT